MSIPHVLVCGASDAAIETAFLLRRLGEAVTLVAEPDDPRVPDNVRSAIVAATSDPVTVEIVRALRAAHPALPLVCCLDDPELASSLDVRTVVCTTDIEAIHRTACALSPGIVGAFALDDDLVVLRPRRPVAPPTAFAASVALAASAALANGMHYAVTLGDRVFSFFEGPAGPDWTGCRPSEVAGTYDFVALFRRAVDGPWRAVDEDDDAFDENETILVAAWRRLEQIDRRANG